MPRDKDNPIREYFEEDLPEERFHRLNERLQAAIDGVPRRVPQRSSAGVSAIHQAIRGRQGGYSLIRWKGCLWHLAVRVTMDTGFKSKGLASPLVFHASCGEVFQVRADVESRLDEVVPHRYLTCTECWEYVEAMQVALILGGEAE
jgi:hypothetical protein